MIIAAMIYVLTIPAALLVISNYAEIDKKYKPQKHLFSLIIPLFNTVMLVIVTIKYLAFKYEY